MGINSMQTSLRGLDQSNQLRQMLARGTNVSNGAPQARKGKTRNPNIGRPSKPKPMMDNQMPSVDLRNREMQTAMAMRLQQMQQQQQAPQPAHQMPNAQMQLAMAMQQAQARRGTGA